MRFTRRGAIGTSVASMTILAAPMVTAQTRAKVVIVGGGAGGATAARYVAKDGGDAVNVTLIEPTRVYYTCFFSNLYLGGFRDMKSLAHDYGKLASEHRINIIHDWATGIDRDARTVALAGGEKVPYDRLILSPGIDFKTGAIPGWDISAQDMMPHAYKAGTPTQLLKAQILAMRKGGTFAMIAPPNPYRCPPGPYERVSMVAHSLKKTNPTAKILIVDPKPKFSKQALFEEGWQAHYGGMIERLGPDFGGENVSVDPEAMTIDIDGAVEKVDVCNVIPAQQAGRIVHQAGLNDGDWAPVNPTDLSSKLDESVHILGDAAAQGDMPRSGFAANSQAKVCANAVLGALTGSRVFPARFSNTCWSLIDAEDGVKVGATYEASEEKITALDSYISQQGESAETRAATFRESLDWYDAITADMFG